MNNLLIWREGALARIKNHAFHSPYAPPPNFTNASYLVIPSAATLNGEGELVQFVESEKQTNYLDLSAVDMSTAVAAKSAATIGFTLEVL